MVRNLAVLLLLLSPLHALGTEPASSCWPGKPGTNPADCPPDDPKYSRHWEFLSTIPEGIDRSKLHPSEVENGAIGFSLDAAWQRTVGRDDVVIAVLDSGIRWHYRDLTRKLYLNSGELPLPQGSSVHDANHDGIFNVDDYEGDPRVSDRNENGLLDPEDLILTFSDCRDDDANGYPDDISGYDFFRGSHCGFAGGDNNPRDDTDFGHGTGIASTAAAETDNGIDDVGVCPRCRILPVRVGDTFVVDANQFARGTVFAVHAGASVIASALGSYNNTPAARFAVDFAYQRGVPIIGSAADEFSYHHNYPSVLNHVLYVNSIRYNHATDFTKASTFWGINPCTNFGARVWITVPATSCSSGSTARLAGVAGLVESMAREADIGGLHAEEVYQVLRMTADDLDNTSPDWGKLRFPAVSGFDQYFGYGRLNAHRAVTAVAAGRIPPMADLTHPRWFAVVSPKREPVLPVKGSIRLPRAARADYRLEYAQGVEPREEEYRLISRGEVEGGKEGTLGVVSFAGLGIPGGPPPRNREERDRYSVTLRLRVTDDRGLTSEARRSFFVLEDPTWKKHFPLDLGASGEASPLLEDLDGDGKDEIVLPTADGYLRIVRWEPHGLRTVRVPLDRGPPVDPTRPAIHRESVVRAAAIGDLHGSGRRSIVVASREGKVYVFSSRGERVPPFPVSPAHHGPAVENGVLSRPVLADLDGKAGLEIVVTGLDGRVHAWRGDGRPLPGFPVELKTSAPHRPKIISAPAVGDLDKDGSPEIIFGSDALRKDLSAVWAVRAGGNAHPGGPFVPGWDPFEVSAVRPDLLPTVASGVSMGPVLVDADADGDHEVVLYAVTASEILLVDQPREGGPRVLSTYSMSPGAGSEFKGITFLAGMGSPLLSDTDGDGLRELYAPLIPFRLLTFRSKPGIPLDVPLALGGWKLAPGEDGRQEISMMPSYPRRMEDIMLFARPAVADVDGDGIAEVLMGSGGYLLHAFAGEGGEAGGFPKFTGGWIFSTPAVGDLDGDGRIDLVTVTREGYLFAWELDAPASSMTR